MEHIMRHTWWRRMWTFQEFILAERPIVVVGNHHLEWNNLVEAANNTFVSKDARQEMVRRRRRHLKSSELVINNIFPPEAAKNIPGMLTSIHLFPLMKDIMDAHKGRLAFQLGFQKFNPNYLAGDLLLKSRLRQAEDPRDKLYALYHVLQACHYDLPKINYAETVEKVYEDVTFSLVSQSQSWWILTHLLHSHTSTATTLEIPSWVPDFNSRIPWHQHIEFFA